MSQIGVYNSLLSKRKNSQKGRILPKVKPSAETLFLSKKTSRDMESVLKNVKEIKW